MAKRWYYDDFLRWMRDGCEPNQQVTFLDLSNNQLTTIPPEIGFLTQLLYLDLKKNQLTTIPPEIEFLKQLQRLYIANNQITTISPEIGLLTQLKELYIANNQITTIPPEIGLLTQLKELYLTDNQIITIPPKIGLLTQLQNLYIANNQLTTIPPEIGLLTQLRGLFLSNNQITIIPPEIGLLTQLQRLHLSCNQIITIPPEIGLLTQLRDLYIANNQLTTIPPEIGLLTQLTDLYIPNNQLTTIPPQLQACRNLNYVYYNNNPIEYVPPCIVRMVQRQHIAQGIYSDNQSVHNSSIQRSIKDSIFNLISLNPKLDFETVTKSIVEDTILSDFTKQSLIDYCNDESTHSTLDITFEELLVAVWNRVVVNEHSTEIKRVLNQEMTDAECKCFTGRISRLVNCLNGFDALVNVKIDDNEQIGNVILVVKQQLGDDYDITKHKSVATTRLKELGYSDEVITVWIDAIEE